VVDERQRFSVLNLDRVAPNNTGPTIDGATNVWGVDGESESFDRLDLARTFAKELVLGLGEHIVVSDNESGKVVWDSHEFRI